ncbi:hypothetical protein GCM10009854_03690 [Saccharopolyspora halophila]|uniref:Secreted protein n=1 Tax=Saccharopolyspora halophila TaxID=405551 RepID=A0ABP5SI25_9PSEU
MTQPSSVVPLITGLVSAAALSGAAAVAVLQSGCEDPGTYLEHDGVVELVGGCLRSSDLPVTPQDPEDPLGSGNPSIAP